MAVTDEMVDNSEKLRNGTSKVQNKPVLPPVATFHSKQYSALVFNKDSFNSHGLSQEKNSKHYKNLSSQLSQSPSRGDAQSNKSKKKP